MRIIKYLFLLLLLSFVALTIFIATQKGDFTVERSKIINSPKSTVFNYINNYKNWEKFGSWTAEDPEIKTTYAPNTIGSGGSYSWEGKDGNGNMETLFVKENDSIVQKMNYNGTSSDVYWSFKDTLGGTKVSWKSKGKMSFGLKIYAALNGGAERIIGKMYEKSLSNLDKILDYETNTYTVKVNGFVKKLESFYLRQSFTSKISNIPKNSKVVFTKIINFCKQNNIILSGKPFIVYHTYDVVKDVAKVSFCIPIKNEIFTSEGSDIHNGKLQSFQAVKTTLTGDYSHNKKALDEAALFFTKNNLIPNSNFSHLEIYTIGKNEVESPSKWVTEIYYPIQPKAIPVKVYKPKAANTQEVIAPATAPIQEKIPAEF